MATEQEFQDASERVKQLSADPGNDAKLKLYALYKQASDGDVSGKRPGLTDFVGRAKYDAWSKLKGTSAEDARQQYVDLVDELSG